MLASARTKRSLSGLRLGHGECVYSGVRACLRSGQSLWAVATGSGSRQALISQGRVSGLDGWRTPVTRIGRGEGGPDTRNDQMLGPVA
jgi:hypothetical protein